MRTLLTVCLAVLLASASSQTTMRPSDLVEAGKKAKLNFKTFQLFERAPELRSEPQVSNGLWMFLNMASIIPLQRERPRALSLPLPKADGTIMELELVQVQLFSADFTVLFSRPYNIAAPEPQGLFYQGRIKGQPESLVAISIFEQEVSGVISTPEEGNLVLGHYKGADPRLHILHADEKMPQRPDFHCLSPDNEFNYRAEELQAQPELRSANPCVRLYLEVDNDVFVDKGGQDGALQYISGLFNQVAALYANENIRLSLSQVFIWNSSSPYTGSDTYTLLTQFQRTRTSFNGDAAELITYKGGGGIAVVDGLCRPYNSFKMGVAGVGRFYSNLPTYSFSVMVVAHELGHVLGSQHTHSCVWNGNNTAIDACPGYTEGNCIATERTPVGGGTIMSYCHLNTVGINFSKGFGPQPGNLIRSRIAAASCLQVCTSDGGSGGNSGGGGNNNATCGEVTFQMNLDLFGSETTWEILNPAGVAVEKGGPYVDKTLGQKIERKACLPFGCYMLKIYDKVGDGICCSYGEGSYRLLDANGTEIGKGGVFGNLSQVNFCVTAPDNGGGNPPPDTKCINIDFNRYPPVSFGGSQDGGTASIAEAGKTLIIKNNAWKAVALNYQVTAKTFLEFEFRSTQLGEIHGIGFDNDENISSPYTFQLWGSQTWGIAEYRNYEGNGQWKKYTIPVGKFYTGSFSRLFFAVDKDAAPYDGESQFRNIRLYEESPCPGIQAPDVELPGTSGVSPNEAPSVVLSPNPGDVQTRFSLFNWPLGQYKLNIYDALGRKVLNNYPLNLDDAQLWEWQINTTHWSSGVYWFTIHNNQVKKSGKMLISRPNH